MCVCCLAAYCYLAYHRWMVFTKLLEFKGSVYVEGQIWSVLSLEMRFTNFSSFGNHVDRQMVCA